VQVDYAPFIDRVIHRYEGGYGWNPKDTGGPTKYGITCYDLAAHRGQRMDSMLRWAPLVQAMQLPEAEAIYQTKYAAGVAFDTMVAGEDCCTLDYAINSGVSRGNLVKAEIYKKYGAAIPAADFVNRMCDERLAFMKAIRGGSAWAEFGHGWQSRVDDLRGYCAHLATGALVALPPPDLTHTAQPKATHAPKTAGTATGGGSIGGMIAAHMAGFHWPTVAAIGAGILTVGVAFEAWEAGKTATANATVHL
jgi:lysozyme family protein